MEQRIVSDLNEVIQEGRCELIGVLRQELLSGIRSQEQFETLRARLRAFPDEPITTEDHEHAAAASNQCRAAGISGSLVDFLLCAISLRRGWSIFTTDPNFANYANVLSVTLHSRNA